MNAGKLVYYFLVVGIILCLLQIWLPAYYVTGDGPCHLYNSAILSDLNSGNSFFSSFFQSNFRPNPNWLTSVLLMGALLAFKAATAEKVFLTIYLAVLFGGHLLMLKKLKAEASLWPLAMLIFVFHHTLAKGFYNFTLGTALYPYMVWAWLRYIDNKNVLNTFLFFFCSLILFFTQLLPFIVAFITCGMLIVSYTAAGEQRDVHRPAIFLLKHVAALVILTSPFLLMAYLFADSGGGLRMHIGLHLYPLRELAEFKYLISTSDRERIFASIAGITFISVLLAGLWRRFRIGSVNKYDGFILSLIFITILYVTVPEQFMGRDILITMRLQLYIFMLAFFIASYSVKVKVANAGGGILFLCFLALFNQRIKVQLAAGRVMQQITEVGVYIAPNSIVLPLCFAPEGRDEYNKPVATRNYLFSHATHYLGCGKNVLLLDNYEALTGYFPLLWRNMVNPYTHLSTCEGFEGLPPSADIRHYEQVAGVNVRYVLRLFYNPDYLNKGHYRSLDSQIVNGYHLVKRSSAGSAELFERNSTTVARTGG